MVTTTYLVLVLVLGALVWWWLTRSARSTRTSTTRRSLRATLTGATADDDLVERMAEELAGRTIGFGSSHAVPGHLGAELPVGVFEAATAARGQLTEEVLTRYCALMEERCRRLGRTPFALPERYGLHLALTCGPEEQLTASFEPIVDVRTTAGRLASPPRLPAVRRPSLVADAPRTRRRGPSGHGLDGQDEITVRRFGRAELEGRDVVLEVQGTPCARGRLGRDVPSLTVGRDRDAALRCPDGVEDVSRRHVLLLWRDGRCWVQDEHSVNGTWLSRPDGQTVPLVPGEPTPWATGEVLLLDEERTATVTLR